MTPKIATCCYCGSRAALVLNAERHELSCANCGAPLHDLKRFPVAAAPKEPTPAPLKKRRPSPPTKYYEKERPKQSYRKKKRKSFVKWALEEAFDVIEDIFD